MRIFASFILKEQTGEVVTENFFRPLQRHHDNSVTSQCPTIRSNSKVSEFF